MTRSQYAVLFAVVGAAVALWSQRRAAASRGDAETGEIIFRNTPLAQ
jgi:hypothetical protein